jgi:hypothetical protein
MFKVRLTSLNKSDLMRERNLMRRPLPNDQWEYYSEIKLLETEAEAHAKAAPYIRQNVRVEIVAYNPMKGEERVVQQLRDIQPQHVYEAQRALLPKEKPTLTSAAKSGVAKVGTAFQLIFFFLLAIAPIAGAKGERWDIAIMIGVVAVVAFMFGKHMNKEVEKAESRQGLERFGRSLDPS